MEKVFFKECFLTDIIKYDALKNWSKIEVGTSLKLQYKSVSSDDSKKALFACLPGTENKIGCLTKEDATLLDQIIAMEWSDVFDCIVSHFNKDEANDQSIKVAIYINKNLHQSDKND